MRIVVNRVLFWRDNSRELKKTTGSLWISFWFLFRVVTPLGLVN